MHVLAYAEVLFRWKLLHKRIELLKAVDPFMRLPSDSYFNSDHSQLGTLRHLGRVYVRCPIPLFITWSSSWDRCIHPMHSVQSTHSFSDSINLFCLWHAPRNAQMFCMPSSRQRRVVSFHVLHSFFNKTCSHRPLLQLFGMSPRQPSILLEVASERHLLNWLSMPLPCHGSGLAQ